MEKKTMEVTMIKQSSIDLLLEKIYIEYKLIPNDDIIEQAKAMHKEEIIKTAGHYFHEHERMTKNTLTPTQYYNETFGGEDE
jgi:hypothetical protein